MNNNGPYQPSIVMSTNQFEEFAALKAEVEEWKESYAILNYTAKEYLAENERLKEGDLHLKKWIDELQADKAEMIEVLKLIKADIYHVKTGAPLSPATLETIGSLLSKHETK